MYQINREAPMNIASAAKISEASALVVVRHPLTSVEVCDGCGDMHVCHVVDQLAFCSDCIIRDILAAEGLRRMSYAEAEAASRAAVLARLDQESESFGL